MKCHDLQNYNCKNKHSYSRPNFEVASNGTFKLFSLVTHTFWKLWVFPKGGQEILNTEQRYPTWTLRRRSVIISAACWHLSGGPVIWAILSGVVPSSGIKKSYSSICNSANLHLSHRNLGMCYKPGLNWILTPASFWIFLIISPFLPITIPTANRGIGT